MESRTCRRDSCRRQLVARPERGRLRGLHGPERCRRTWVEQPLRRAEHLDRGWPDFREHGVSNVPTSNADLAPTLLRLCGLDVPPAMTGRVIEEGFRNGPPPASVRMVMSAETVKTADGSYELTAHFTTAGSHRYLDYTDVKR